MKWLALFWVYRREFFAGWKRGWRKSRWAFLKPDAIIMPQEAANPFPGWIRRPLEAPEFSSEAVRRLYGDLVRAANRP